MSSKFTIAHVLGLCATGSFAASRLTSFELLQALLASLFIAIPLYYIVYASYIYPFYLSELRSIPTVRGFPLWGQFFQIITTECGIPQRKWHQDHGMIVRYFFPFGAERLSIADEKALYQMTMKNYYNYPKPLRARLWMRRILGEGVLLAEGQEHARQRKALAPGFSITSIRALSHIFWGKALLMSKLWKEEMGTRPEHIFEVLDWLNRTTLDIIGEAGFGMAINSLENPDAPLREAYRLVFAFDIFSRAMHGLQAFIPVTKCIPSKMNRDVEASRKIILTKATEIVSEKEKQAQHHTNHKDILALISKDNQKLKDAGEAGLSFKTIRDQVMTFLGAGHDTTATGVCWTLHLISKHQHIQNRLREEIREYMPFLFDPQTRYSKESIRDADPDKLPYLENVCRESLRFIPPIPMTVRELIAPDILGPYQVPAGTTVYIHANAINRMKEYWGPTADEFDPDRWENLPETWCTMAFMTFLQGQRGCVGRKFAEMEMKVILCSLLSKFEFAPDPTVQDPEELKMWRLVLRPKDGVSLKVRELSS